MDEAEFLGQVNAQAEDQTDDNQAEENQIDDNQADDNQEQGEALNLSTTEQKAYDQGWRPQEDFSGAEDNWKTAKEYIRDGEWLAQLKEANQKTDRLEREFNDRLENTNKLNDARRNSEIADLKKQQREAVDLADADVYDNAQKKIDSLEAEAFTPVVPGKDPAIEAWESSNPWINDESDERTAVAQGIFNNYTAQNRSATVAQALAHVDGKINKLYPSDNTNPRRDQPNATENVKRTPQRRNKELSMADLTQGETNEWNQFGKMMFKTEKAYLKAVKDARVK